MEKSKDLSKSMGKQIKEKRSEKGWTQAKLAEEANLTVSYISSIEKGVRNLTINVLSNIAKALGTSASVIYQEVEKELDDNVL